MKTALRFSKKTTMTSSTATMAKLTMNKQLAVFVLILTTTLQSTAAWLNPIGAGAGTRLVGIQSRSVFIPGTFSIVPSNSNSMRQQQPVSNSQGSGSGSSTISQSSYSTSSSSSSLRSLSLSRFSLLTMKIPRIDDWKVMTNGRVMGSIRGHPTIPNGNTITTSPIQNPQTARAKLVVQTIAGNKYLLGTPAYANVRIGNAEGTSKMSIRDLQKRAKIEMDLNGEVVGDDDRQYLLSGRPMKSTSGKSNIFKAYRSDDDGLPSGDPVLVKVSSNWEALEREYGNYQKITQSGLARGQFVKLVDYLPVASTVTRKFRNMSALVMERGLMDLKRYVQANGRLQGKQLRDACAAAAQCLSAVHTSRLVWTDMKSENFIVGQDGSIKGIDLESAMPVGDNPVDYSPEATPPEFAKAFLAGDGPYFVLEYNYDMWSFGMMLYEMAVGKGYFDGKSPVVITKNLRAGIDIDVSTVDIDENLKDLILKCTNLDPKRRPNILQVLLHPYFLKTGLGPISF